MTDVRRARGLEIAATTFIKKKGDSWIVPSQSLNGSYTVTKNKDVMTCTCPDFGLRLKKCKHMWAVEFAAQRESSGEAIAAEPKVRRQTYPQNWPTYNLAQTNEKQIFCHLLRELCGLVAPPTEQQPKRGRPRIPQDDALFVAAYKVYSTLSGRRFMSDVREAAKEGFIEKPPCYNSIFRVLEAESSTPLIKKLIEMSSLPLRSVEVDFAVDSTGYGLGRFYRHYSAKYGHDQLSRDYVKVHAMFGVKTHVVTAVEVTDRDAHDSPLFRPLLEATNKRFKMREVSADKAYSSRNSLLLVDYLGATPYIPFKSNAKVSRNSIIWNRVFHYYMLNREQFLEHYHKRSNAESAFSSMKRKFGDFLRSRTPVAQTNEMLLKILAHNVVCLVHSMYELGISEMFGYSLPKKTRGDRMSLVMP